MFLDKKSGCYVLLIISTLIFTYFGSGLAADPVEDPGPIVIS
ncbi:hypothetical protein RBH29_10440 [Herbivorax sp. ANBcel31]|nr:hypothetical protein [Herbivorax sp. ANBcel31]MDQ2086843.1 hypothetical protein [Herbivorax sp. ANBcel31]